MTDTNEAAAHTHSDEPHTHTLTFTDSSGTSHAFDVPCPDDDGLTALARGLEGTGADKVNGLAVDGRPMSFEGVFARLGAAGKLDMLGDSYQTPENLFRLMVAMGTMEVE